MNVKKSLFTKSKYIWDGISKARKLDYFCYVGVFLLYLVSCWLLSLAYPQGLVTEETLSYWWLQRDFQLFTSNQLDFFRTIPYGTLLSIFSHFDNPTISLYWLNALIFSVNGVLVFVLGRLLFASRLSALVLSVSALIFEIASMHIFYINLQICADPFYSELIYFSTLLSLIAWMKCWNIMLVVACAFFGIASFIKPVGLFLCFVYVVFSVCCFCFQRATWRYKLVLSSACLLLTFGPLSIWSLRNFCLYGYANFSGVGGSALLCFVLPLLTREEILFDRIEDNQEFHRSVRDCEMTCKRYVLPSEIANESMGRTFRFERYYIYGPAFDNPFLVLGRITKPGWNKHGPQRIDSLDPKHMFAIDLEAKRIALRIISDHPVGYLSLVGREYLQMFQPSLMYTNPLYEYQSDPAVAYKYWDIEHQGFRPPYNALYPGSGVPTGTNSNRAVAEALGALHYNSIVGFLLHSYYEAEFLLSHLLFCAAIIFYIQLYLSVEMFAEPERAKWLAVALIMLFLTAASNSLVVSLCQIAKLRYQLAGDMELHLMLLIATIVGMHFIFHSRQWDQLSRKT